MVRSNSIKRTLLKKVACALVMTVMVLSRSLLLAINSIMAAIRNQFGRMELSVAAITNVVLPLRST